MAGTVFAVAIATLGAARGQRELSTLRAASFGALGGAVIFLVIWFGFLGRPLLGPLYAALAPAALFALIGAATGLAIRATANHAKLPSGASSTRIAPP